MADPVNVLGRDGEFGAGGKWVIAPLGWIPCKSSLLPLPAMDPNRSSESFLFRELARWLARRGHDWHGSPPKLSTRQRVRRFVLGSLGCYLLAPLVIFDFTETAYAYDQEGVAIGPKPYFLVPGAIRDFDYPGGPDYTDTAWPFVVWKPLCVVYCRVKGLRTSQ